MMMWTLLAQEGFPVPSAESEMEMRLMEKLLQPDTMVFLVAIVAILVCGLLAVTKLVIRHRERIAMIEQGMHPDERPGDAG